MIRISASPTSLALVLLAAALGAAPAGAAEKSAKPSAPAARKAPSKGVYVPLPDAPPEQVEAAGQVYYGVYDCEFQQTVRIDKSSKNVAYVDVFSGKSQWLMKPVLSSTGAIRLEDVKGETLMVQISSKSMLLNVKTAQRIVDDCISPRQRELIEAARAAKAAAAKAAAESPAEPSAANSAAPLPLLK